MPSEGARVKGKRTCPVGRTGAIAAARTALTLCGFVTPLRLEPAFLQFTGHLLPRRQGVVAPSRHDERTAHEGR